MSRSNRYATAASTGSSPRASCCWRDGCNTAGEEDAGFAGLLLPPHNLPSPMRGAASFCGGSAAVSASSLPAKHFTSVYSAECQVAQAVPPPLVLPLPSEPPLHYDAADRRYGLGDEGLWQEWGCPGSRAASPALRGLCSPGPASLGGERPEEAWEAVSNGCSEIPAAAHLYRVPSAASALTGITSGPSTGAPPSPVLNSGLAMTAVAMQPNLMAARSARLPPPPGALPSQQTNAGHTAAPHPAASSRRPGGPSAAVATLATVPYEITVGNVVALSAASPRGGRCTTVLTPRDRKSSKSNAATPQSTGGGSACASAAQTPRAATSPAATTLACSSQDAAPAKSLSTRTASRGLVAAMLAAANRWILRATFPAWKAIRSCATARRPALASSSASQEYTADRSLKLHRRAAAWVHAAVHREGAMLAMQRCFAAWQRRVFSKAQDAMHLAALQQCERASVWIYATVHDVQAVAVTHRCFATWQRRASSKAQDAKRSIALRQRRRAALWVHASAQRLQAFAAVQRCFTAWQRRAFSSAQEQVLMRTAETTKDLEAAAKQQSFQQTLEFARRADDAGRRAQGAKEQEQALMRIAEAEKTYSELEAAAEQRTIQQSLELARRADEAERRAHEAQQQAKERIEEAEQRVNEAQQQVKRHIEESTQQIQEAEQQAAQAKLQLTGDVAIRAAEAEQRAVEAEQRMKEAERRSQEFQQWAELQVQESARRAEEAEQRAAEAEEQVLQEVARRAQEAERQAVEAERQVIEDSARRVQEVEQWAAAAVESTEQRLHEAEWRNVTHRWRMEAAHTQLSSLSSRLLENYQACVFRLCLEVWRSVCRASTQESCLEKECFIAERSLDAHATEQVQCQTLVGQLERFEAAALAEHSQAQQQAEEARCHAESRECALLAEAARAKSELVELEWRAERSDMAEREASEKAARSECLAEMAQETRSKSDAALNVALNQAASVYQRAAHSQVVACARWCLGTWRCVAFAQVALRAQEVALCNNTIALQEAQAALESAALQSERVAAKASEEAEIKAWDRAVARMAEAECSMQAREDSQGLDLEGEPPEQTCFVQRRASATLEKLKGREYLCTELAALLEESRQQAASLKEAEAAWASKASFEVEARQHWAERAELAELAHRSASLLAAERTEAAQSAIAGASAAENAHQLACEELLETRDRVVELAAALHAAEEQSIQAKHEHQQLIQAASRSAVEDRKHYLKMLKGRARQWVRRLAANLEVSRETRMLRNILLTWWQEHFCRRFSHYMVCAEEETAAAQQALLGESAFASELHAAARSEAWEVQENSAVALALQSRMAALEVSEKQAMQLAKSAEVSAAAACEHTRTMQQHCANHLSSARSFSLRCAECLTTTTLHTTLHGWHRLAALGRAERSSLEALREAEAASAGAISRCEEEAQRSAAMAAERIEQRSKMQSLCHAAQAQEADFIMELSQASAREAWEQEQSLRRRMVEHSQQALGAAVGVCSRSAEQLDTAVMQVIISAWRVAATSSGASGAWLAVSRATRRKRASPGVSVQSQSTSGVSISLLPSVQEEADEEEEGALQAARGTSAHVCEQAVADRDAAEAKAQKLQCPCSAHVAAAASLCTRVAEVHIAGLLQVVLVSWRAEAALLFEQSHRALHAASRCVVSEAHTAMKLFRCFHAWRHLNDLEAIVRPEASVVQALLRQVRQLAGWAAEGEALRAGVAISAWRQLVDMTKHRCGLAAARASLVSQLCWACLRAAIAMWRAAVWTLHPATPSVARIPVRSPARSPTAGTTPAVLIGVDVRSQWTAISRQADSTLLPRAGIIARSLRRTEAALQIQHRCRMRRWTFSAWASMAMGTALKRRSTLERRLATSAGYSSGLNPENYTVGAGSSWSGEQRTPRSAKASNAEVLAWDGLSQKLYDMDSAVDRLQWSPIAFRGHSSLHKHSTGPPFENHEEQQLPWHEMLSGVLDVMLLRSVLTAWIRHAWHRRRATQTAQVTWRTCTLAILFLSLRAWRVGGMWRPLQVNERVEAGWRKQWASTRQQQRRSWLLLSVKVWMISTWHRSRILKAVTAAWCADLETQAVLLLRTAFAAWREFHFQACGSSVACGADQRAALCQAVEGTCRLERVRSDRGALCALLAAWRQQARTTRLAAWRWWCYARTLMRIAMDAWSIALLDQHAARSSYSSRPSTPPASARRGPLRPASQARASIACSRRDRPARLSMSGPGSDASSGIPSPRRSLSVPCAAKKARASSTPRQELRRSAEPGVPPARTTRRESGWVSSAHQRSGKCPSTREVVICSDDPEEASPTSLPTSYLSLCSLQAQSDGKGQDVASLPDVDATAKAHALPDLAIAWPSVCGKMSSDSERSASD